MTDYSPNFGASEYVEVNRAEYEALVEIARIADALCDDALCNLATSAEAFLRLDLRAATSNYQTLRAGDTCRHGELRGAHCPKCARENDYR